MSGTTFLSISRLSLCILKNKTKKSMAHLTSNMSIVFWIRFPFFCHFLWFLCLLHCTGWCTSHFSSQIPWVFLQHFAQQHTHTLKHRFFFFFSQMYLYYVVTCLYYVVSYAAHSKKHQSTKLILWWQTLQHLPVSLFENGSFISLSVSFFNNASSQMEFVWGCPYCCELLHMMEFYFFKC